MRLSEITSPQLKDGFTPIANEIVEALYRTNLYPYESRVLWYIFRKTYGFRKKTDWITLSQFSKAIGLDRRLVHRALKNLSSKKIIVIYTDDKKRIRYGFQKNYKKWKSNIVISKDDKGVIYRDDRVSSIEIPTKETITKENIYICGFDEFWKIYPARNGKKLEKSEALKRFQKLKENEIPLILKAVKNYANSEDVKNGIGIRDPKRFLRDDKGNRFWREWVGPETKPRRFDEIGH